jgi:hypothetical protein
MYEYVYMGKYGWSARRKASTCTQTQKNQQTMPWVGFKLQIPASERAKTVYALDRSATVSGYKFYKMMGISWGAKQLFVFNKDANPWS